MVRTINNAIVSRGTMTNIGAHNEKTGNNNAGNQYTNLHHT